MSFIEEGFKRLSLYCTKCRAICWSIIKCGFVTCIVTSLPRKLVEFVSLFLIVSRLLVKKYNWFCISITFNYPIMSCSWIRNILLQLVQTRQNVNRIFLIKTPVLTTFLKLLVYKINYLFFWYSFDIKTSKFRTNL